MALRQILLSRQIEERRKQLEALRAKWKELEERRKALTTREAELETAIGEVTDETPAEEREALDAATEEWKNNDTALTGEENENNEQQTQLEGEIAQLEGELNEINERTNRALKSPAPAAPETRQEEKTTMNTRTKFFGMTIHERDAFIAREDVKGFMTRLRDLGKQERAVSGAELLIPTVVLDLIREQIEGYSKLYKHVRVRKVSGHARQTVMGTMPEGVWTEACAILNELTIGFNRVEVDGFKVGGYVAVCNALLEDSDVNLAIEIIDTLGYAIGFAVDKVIPYGTGTKMPMGIVTRLVQTTAPQNYPATARSWEDLHTSNVISIPNEKSTGINLFQEIIKAFGNAKGKYSAGSKFFAMNEKTHNALMAEAMSVNAVGAIVSGQQGVMPVIGGAIETLSFIPDNVIIGGYGDLYLLAERAGTTVAQSKEVRFIEDQTVFKATARYDGMPMIAEGFVAIGINGATVSANAVTFAADTANTTTET